MQSRRKFITSIASLPLMAGLSRFLPAGYFIDFQEENESDFCRRLEPIGRILESKDYYVWGTSPIKDPQGLIHVFYSRWPAERGMGGWINRSEIAHAIAERPEGPYETTEVLFAPRNNGYWDSTTCHNPHIKFVDGKYCLFYIGNSNGKTNTKRIGLATSDSLYGPWARPDEPLLETGPDDTWDNHCTSNPSFIKHPHGSYWLYYKSWNSGEYYQSKHPSVRGNRKYGLAIANRLEGPYQKYDGNPIIDYSMYGNNRQLEDAFVYMENGKFNMLARDMGKFGHQMGIHLESKDGIHWSEPLIAYYGTDHYFKQPPAPGHLKKYGRFERPQLLITENQPTHLFVTTQGGKYMHSTAFVFRIKPDPAKLTN